MQRPRPAPFVVLLSLAAAVAGVGAAPPASSPTPPASGQAARTPPIRPMSAAEVRSLRDLLFLRHPGATVAVTAATEDGREGYVEGERFRLRVEADAECFLTVVAFGPDGSVEQLAPAAATTGSKAPITLRRGEPLLLPRGDASFKALAPHCETTFRIFATPVAIDLPAEAPAAGGKGVGVATGPASPFEGDAWGETTVLVMTGSTIKDLAERMGMSEEDAKRAPKDRVGHGEAEEPALPELPELPDEIPLELPTLERERPARRNPGAPLVPQSDSSASTEYRNRWTKVVEGQSGSKAIGTRLVPPRPTQHAMPRLNDASTGLLVVRRAPSGSKAIGGRGGYVTERVPLVPPGSKAIGASPDEVLRKRVAELRGADPSIVTVVPNRPIAAFGDPPSSETSIFTELQWHLANQVATAMDIRWIHRVLDIMDVKSVLIGMVDQGIHVDDQRLRRLIAVNAGETADNGIDDDRNGLVDDVYGWNFASGTPSLSTANDAFNHGSYCSSIIGGNAGGGRFSFFPVTYSARIIPSACMAWDDKAGAAQGNTDTLLKAIEYAVDRGAKVINLSLGGPCSRIDLLLLEHHPLFAKLREKDVLLIIAAGNENTDIDEHPVSPASLDIPNSIVVMATDPDGQPAREFDAAAGEWKQYTNWGRNTVHIAAPGTMILGIPSVDATSYGNGTSYATPIVTAAAALLWGLHPEWDGATVKRAILETARQVEGLDDKCLTGGMLDLDAAMGWKP